MRNTVKARKNIKSLMMYGRVPLSSLLKVSRQFKKMLEVSQNRVIAAFEGMPNPAPKVLKKPAIRMTWCASNYF